MYLHFDGYVCKSKYIYNYNWHSSVYFYYELLKYFFVNDFLKSLN